jgi:hypothetical protein
MSGDQSSALLPEPGGLSLAAPTPRDVAVSLGGLLALGVVSVSGGGLSAVSEFPAPLLVQAGGLLLAAPALLVSHQLLGLYAAPSALVHSVGRGLVRAGHLALGLAPAMLFFSATTRTAGLLLALALGLVSVATLSAVWRDLVDAEGAALDASATEGVEPMRALAFGWCLLVALLAVRLAWVSFPPMFS